MHNLGTVIRFEISRTLKKKSFWIMAFSFPIMLGVVFGIIYFSNKATDEASSNLGKQKFSFEITDESHLVNPELVHASGGVIIADKQQGISDVQSGKVDAYIYYPTDLKSGSIETYGKDVSIFDNGRYSSVARGLLLGSVEGSVRSDISMIIRGQTSSVDTIYRDGKQYDPAKEMILPGVFLLLFYVLIAFFGSQMLTSTTEEKENRVIEMLLTTIAARTLIVGKIISLVALALFQGCIIVIPVVIGYLVFHDKLSLPSFDLSTLPVNWTSITTAAVLFGLSFLLFTGLLVLVGAMVPTAKEAGQFFGVVMILLFGPLYAAPLFVSAPHNGFVTFLSLFPLTAPIPLLLRNAIGNLQPWELAVALPILALSSVVITLLAVRAFRYGVLEYSRKLSFKEILRRS